MDASPLINELVTHPISALFLVIALGTGLGNLRLANLSLGTSGVLFVGLLFGHFGLVIPKVIEDLGIILFVYAIGLQAGPRFFNQFRQRGVLFAKIGITVICVGAAATWLLTRLMHIDPALAIGMFAGAMTSTPGLAAATDAARNPTVGLGFGLAYPFGVIGVVLFVQLLPRLLRIDLAGEATRLKQAASSNKPLQRRQFRVSNPACFGRTLAQLQLHQISEVNITRISRENQVMPASPDSALEANDVVLAVGRPDELEKLTLLFGEEMFGEDIFATTDVVARDVMVSNDQMVGKTLAELQILKRYGIVISRVFREELDFVPTGSYRIELGDTMRLTGSRQDCDKFVAEAGQQEKRIHETSITALSIGILLGILLAYKEFSLPWGGSFRLGLAGGPLLVSLVLAHFGRIGRLNIRTPRGAKYVLQQLGLVLFLAGAGTAAGGSIGGVLSNSGAAILLAGALVTVVSALSGFVTAYWVYRLDFLTVLGAISGAMTSTPALGAISDLSDRNEPILAYTAVYPVALIFITVISQVLYFLL